LLPQGALNFSSQWSASQIRALDPVASAIASNANGIADAFWWSHHTFTHENLDNATAYDARAQIELNIAMAVCLGGGWGAGWGRGSGAC
jgi:hypothetical protein